MLEYFKNLYTGLSTQQLIGNIVALFGCIVMVGIGFIKHKKQILLAQCVQNVLLGTSNLLLGGISGFITNVVTIIRNLVAFQFPFTLPFKLVFIAIQILLTAIFNNLGWIGWMPALAGCLFIWFLDAKSDMTFKIVIITTQILWTIFDWTIKSYTTLVFDFFTMASNLVGIVLILQEKKGMAATNGADSRRFLP